MNGQTPARHYYKKLAYAKGTWKLKFSNDVIVKIK